MLAYYFSFLLHHLFFLLNKEAKFLLITDLLRETTLATFGLEKPGNSGELLHVHKEVVSLFSAPLHFLKSFEIYLMSHYSKILLLHFPCLLLDLMVLFSFFLLYRQTLFLTK